MKIFISRMKEADLVGQYFGVTLGLSELLHLKQLFHGLWGVGVNMDF